MEAMALTVGMPDFQCFVEYWATRNWVCDYGGVLHPMTKDEIGRAMANWKTMDAEIRKKYANAKRNQDRNRTSTASLPATYLKSPDGKYTPEKCGF
jgi:hypothetical protein